MALMPRCGMGKKRSPIAQNGYEWLVYRFIFFFLFFYIFQNFRNVLSYFITKKVTELMQNL